MRTRFVSVIVFSVLLPLLLVSSAIAEFRVATVDINQVINEAKDAKAKRTELDKMTAEAKELIKAKGERLEQTREKLQSGEIKADSKEAQAFREEAREFSKFVQDKEKEVQGRFVKLNRELTKSAVSVVDDYAKQNKIDLVLDKAGEGRGPVLYGASTFDITEEIVKRVNK